MVGDRVVMGPEPMFGSGFRGAVVGRDRLTKDETKAIRRIRDLMNRVDLMVLRETLGQMRRKTPVEDLPPRPGIVLLGCYFQGRSEAGRWQGD